MSVSDEIFERRFIFIFCKYFLPEKNIYLLQLYIAIERKSILKKNNVEKVYKCLRKIIFEYLKIDWQYSKGKTLVH